MKTVGTCLYSKAVSKYWKSSRFFFLLDRLGHISKRLEIKVIFHTYMYVFICGFLFITFSCTVINAQKDLVVALYFSPVLKFSTCFAVGCSERERNSYLPYQRSNQGESPDIQFRCY